MPEAASIAVELSFPSLPEGFRGTPQALLDWISENALFRAAGSFLTGQIGGSRPTDNVGIYINGLTIELWGGSADVGYLPQNSIPVGCVLDWPSVSPTPPPGYLFAEGQNLLKSEYPELFTVLGTTYNAVGSTFDSALYFQLPDYRGRAGFGAHDGANTDGKTNTFNPGTWDSGSLTRRIPGTYFGSEFAIPSIPTPPNAGTPRYTFLLSGAGNSSPPYAWNKSTFHGTQNPAIGVRKIIFAGRLSPKPSL